MKLGNSIYKVVGAGLIFYALVYGMTATLPEMKTLAQSSRNLFYHVPMWFTEVVLMSISVFFSIRYLRMTDPDAQPTSEPLIADARARESAMLGVMFNGLGLITGIIWGRVSWGQNIPSDEFAAWWIWDPIQTCALISMLIYLGYFLLRSSFAEPEQRAKISAVYNIFAFAALIPLFFVIPRILGGLHPTAQGENTGLFDTKNVTNIYRMVLYPSALGFILLSIWIYQVRVRLSTLTLRLEHLLAEKSYKNPNS